MRGSVVENVLAEATAPVAGAVAATTVDVRALDVVSFTSAGDEFVKFAVFTSVESAGDELRVSAMNDKGDVPRDEGASKASVAKLDSRGPEEVEGGGLMS